MSPAAVLRSACRALRWPSSPGSALLVTKEQLFLHRSSLLPREIITSRRLYRSDPIGNTPKLNTGGYPGHHGKSVIPPAVAERMCSKLDKVIASYDRQNILVNQIEENMRNNYERRLEARGRRVLFAAAAIIVSIVVYVKKQRSKKINNSTEHQEMAS